MLNLMTPDEMYCFTIKNPMGHLWRVYEVPDDCSANRASVFAVSEPVINTFSKCHTISLSVKKGKNSSTYGICASKTTCELLSTVHGKWRNYRHVLTLVGQPLGTYTSRLSKFSQMHYYMSSSVAESTLNLR